MFEKSDILWLVNDIDVSQFLTQREKISAVITLYVNKTKTFKNYFSYVVVTVRSKWYNFSDGKWL